MARQTGGAYAVEREKQIACGQDWLEVDIGLAYHQPRGRGRTPRHKESCPAQRNLNDRNARKYLVRTILTNFFPGDYCAEFTYNPQSCPRTPEELNNRGVNLMRRIKDCFKRQGLPAPRYILINAWGISRQTGKMVRPHHHLIVSGGLTAEQVLQLWRRPGKHGTSYGYVNYSPLQFDADTGITGLAIYLSEQPTHGRRWHGSRNLQAPMSTTNDSRLSRRRVDRMINDDTTAVYGNDCRGLVHYEDWCKLYPGFRLVGYEPRWIEGIGAWYLSLRLKRIEDTPPSSKSKKGGNR